MVSRFGKCFREQRKAEDKLRPHDEKIKLLRRTRIKLEQKVLGEVEATKALVREAKQHSLKAEDVEEKSEDVAAEMDELDKVSRE